jgi:hypothetical protein
MKPEESPPLTRVQGDLVPGLAIGLLLGVLFVLAPVLWLGGDRVYELALLVQPMWSRLQDLATTNLKVSLVPFAAVSLSYCWLFRALARNLAASPPSLEQVVRHDQLLDLCASLFLGVGVIWTAVGMRDALLFSLGDPGLAAREGAFSVLQRLIEGGILIALSSTIVGGTGAYLMRLVKSLVLGRRLNAVYLSASRQPLQDGIDALGRIEHLLARPGEAGTADRDGQ